MPISQCTEVRDREFGKKLIDLRNSGIAALDISILALGTKELTVAVVGDLVRQTNDLLQNLEQLQIRLTTTTMGESSVSRG